MVVMNQCRPNRPQRGHVAQGVTAQSAGDSATALAAYKKFLKLSPNDPLTPQVKQQIKTLAAQAAAAPATSASK